MIPEKESLVYFEQLAQQQQRIWNDSCDVGVLLTETLKTEARRNLLALMRCYKYDVQRYGRNNENSTTLVRIPFERDGEFYSGVHLNVGFHRVGAGIQRREYLSIDITRHFWRPESAIGEEQ